MRDLRRWAEGGDAVSSLHSVALVKSDVGLPGVEIDGKQVHNVTALSIGYEAGGYVACKLTFLPSEVSAQIAGAWVKCANCDGDLTVEGDLSEPASSLPVKDSAPGVTPGQPEPLW